MRYQLSFYLLLSCFCLNAQSDNLNIPEFQIAYFGDLVAHPGVKLGVHVPVKSVLKSKAVEHTELGTFNKINSTQFKLGGNFAAYHQHKSHVGYLANVELTIHYLNRNSLKPKKQRHLELGVGLGYYQYVLKGTSFSPIEGGFEETDGKGSALMPSISGAFGTTFKSIKFADIRWFTKGSIYLEIPHGIGSLPHFVLEIGLATKLIKKKDPHEPKV